MDNYELLQIEAKVLTILDVIAKGVFTTSKQDIILADRRGTTKLITYIR